jgi:signal peptidase I
VAFFSAGVISSFFFAYTYVYFGRQSYLKGFPTTILSRFLYNSFLLGIFSLLFVAGINQTVTFPGKNQPGYQLYRMPSSSMHPTIQSDEIILVHTGHFTRHEYQRQNLVFFEYETMYNLPLVKRIIALEGDTVAIQSGVALVNGEEYDEYYVDTDKKQKSLSNRMPARVIPGDHLFILGDNRDDSYDSRFWGSIPESTVIGKPVYIVWSDDPDRIGEIR